MLCHLVLVLLFAQGYSGLPSSRVGSRHWEDRLTNAIFGPIPTIHPGPAEFEPTVKNVKRALSEEVVPVTAWAYSIVHWAIVSPTLIFAISNTNSVLVSQNSLLTFDVFGGIPPSAGSRQVWHNKAHPSHIMIFGNNVVYTSIDSGITFTENRGTPSLLGAVGAVFHPIDSNLALASGTNEYSDALYITQDFGRTWRILARGVQQYHWCRAGVGDIPSGRICVISAGTNGTEFKFSNTLGLDWTFPLRETALFFRVHDRFFTLFTTNTNASSSMWVSNNDGASFHRAVLPRGVTIGTVRRSQFLEDDNGVIWIVVNPERTIKNKSQKGNLYTSDADGYEFSLVLRDVHTYNDYWDVDLISFMEGTLFANVLADATAENPILRTRITYDNGDTWESLEPPPKDVKGKAYVCPRGQKCSLNLFGITTWFGVGGDGYFGDLYTQPDAVGLIIGTGNVGPYLVTEREKINTYLSRDGGLTWDEIMDQSTIYDFGDFGGLIVLANNRVETKKVFYSWDGGETFGSVDLPKKVFIYNIITVSTHAETFIVLSYEVVGRAKVQRVWGLDFSKLHGRNCTAADYEEWVPHNGVRGPQCVLGHNTIYRRRKRNTTCYTEEDINKVVNVTNCPCTDNDYECDLNFDRTEGSGKCVYEGNDLDLISRQNGCANGEKTYKVSSGYRKIPGDTCINPLTKHNPTLRACPEVVGPGSAIPTIAIAVGAIVLVLVALVVGFCLGVRD
jgi:hypothetical protein